MREEREKMAMDLSTRQQEDLNNNLTCSAVVDLSLPRKKEDAENRETKELVKEAGDEEGKTTRLLIGEGSKLSELLGLGKDPSVLESLLPQLDMAAINLLCLARLQVVHYCTLSLSDLWVTRQECKVGTPYMRV